MKRLNRSVAAVSLVLVALGSNAAFADLYQVSIDLAGLGGSDFRLRVDLYDNSGTIGDSSARLDNAALGSAIDNFDDGTLGAFIDGLNPDSVAATPGSLTGAGGYVLQIDEDLWATPTIVFRDYAGPDGSVLTFDLEMTASDTVGSWGLDQLVVSLVGSDWAPLVDGLTGLGDVLALDAGGIQLSSEASAVLVPAPTAVLLGLLGFGAGGLGLWLRRTADLL
jgi:hypothetical protein